MPPPDAAPDGDALLARERDLLAREESAFVARTRYDAVRIFALQAAALAALLLAWWGASGTLIDPLFLSDPISVIRVLYEIIADGTLWWHLEWTLVEMTLGYVLGVSVGLVLAIAITSLPWATQIVRPMMLGLFAIPKVALAPLIIVWFGIYLVPKIVLAASLVLFIVYFNTVAGIVAVNHRTQEVLRVMGASSFAVLTKLTLPSAMPYIFTAMRITVPGALIGAIIGEFLSSNRGIGFLIAAASSRYDTARVFAGILSLLIFVLLLNAVISRLERYQARWQPVSESKAKL
jgi:NitT/TauT family transport system permease protein